MMKKSPRFLLLSLVTLVALSASWSASAVELDWSGQFRAENHFIGGYVSTSDLAATSGAPQLTPDPNAPGVVPTGGYGVISGGQSTAQFQPLFLRLRPRLLVNDNVYLKTEWWVGDPIFGMFGNASPFSSDQLQFYSGQSRGSVITAQRFWGEIQTDFGLVQVGRMPLNYGLGIVWNSGDGLFDRYQSTGDAIRYTAKLGSLTFAPAIIKYSMGNTAGGDCAVSGTGCRPQPGRGNVYDWSAMVKYEVLDEDLEVSANFIRHIVDAGQDMYLGFGSAAGSAFTTYDLYARKRIGKLTLAGEVPIVSGDVAGIKRSTTAVAVEASYKASNSLEGLLKVGRAPGQASYTGAAPAAFNAFFFNPNYRLGLVMFNYALNNMAGLHSLNSGTGSATQLASPFDNPVVNATYVAFATTFSTDKWQFKPGFVFATADQTALNGLNFYNTQSRRFFANNSGKDQGKSLGTEFDFTVNYQMDESFSFGIDTGLFFPGSFYKFSNGASDNSTPTLFANVLRVGVTF